jgi:hypothetical protein
LEVAVPTGVVFIDVAAQRLVLEIRKIGREEEVDITGETRPSLLAI